MLQPTREEMLKDDLIVTMRGLPVEIQKSHHTGLMAGLKTNEVMHFSSWAEAIDWMDRVNANDSCPYKVIFVENLVSGDIYV